MTKCIDCGYNDNGTGDSAHHCYRTPCAPLIPAPEQQSAWTAFSDAMPPDNKPIFWRDGDMTGSGWFCAEDSVEWTGYWMLPPPLVVKPPEPRTIKPTPPPNAAIEAAVAGLAGPVEQASAEPVDIDSMALASATRIMEMYWESIPGVQLKAKIQCEVRDVMAAYRPAIPPQQAPEPAPESVRDAAAQRLLRATKVYTINYLQDENEEPELCTCGPKQHADLAELFSAISAMEGKAQ